MHPEVRSATEGTCPKCKMALVLESSLVPAAKGDAAAPTGDHGDHEHGGH